MSNYPFWSCLAVNNYARYSPSTEFVYMLTITVGCILMQLQLPCKRSFVYPESYHVFTPMHLLLFSYHIHCVSSFRYPLVFDDDSLNVGYIHTVTSQHDIPFPSYESYNKSNSWTLRYNNNATIIKMNNYFEVLFSCKILIRILFHHTPTKLQGPIRMLICLQHIRYNHN
jgi:hypothetical protein